LLSFQVVIRSGFTHQPGVSSSFAVNGLQTGNRERPASLSYYDFTVYTFHPNQKTLFGDKLRYPLLFYDLKIFKAPLLLMEQTNLLYIKPSYTLL
jgi:hypothetical protein